jgi:MarR family transcriptional regulator, organic hydroperoxide resistance regulator
MRRSNSSRPATEPPAIGIGKLLRRAHMAFSREFRDRLAQHDVTFGEFVHLERLWDEDGLTQTELSDRVGIVTASSTQIIETLEKRGFITRQRNHEDRRRINVYLTRAGRHLKQPLLSRAKETNRIARFGLGSKEILLLFRLIEKVIGNLEAVAVGDSPGVPDRRKGLSAKRSARKRFVSQPLGISVTGSTLR